MVARDDGARPCNQYVPLTDLDSKRALQCANDLVAIGAADTLMNQGIRIPTDLSVMGFGNVMISEFFRVPLTTVRQPKLRLGSVAMEMMSALLRGEAVANRRLAAEVVVRASTAPPPPGVAPAPVVEPGDATPESIPG